MHMQTELTALMMDLAGYGTIRVILIVKPCSKVWIRVPPIKIRPHFNTLCLVNCADTDT